MTSIIRNITTKKISGPYDFIAEFYLTFKEEVIQILFKLLKKTERVNTSKLILQGQHYSDAKARQGHNK